MCLPMIASTSSSQQQQLLELDRQAVWHPYSSCGTNNTEASYLVDSAQGVNIHLADGRTVIDGMSSWWCALHGYNHPILNQALIEQSQKMSHIMFGGLTHQPAIELAQLLVEISPAGLNKVFFSDSGSVAVEVAIKMALQYWHADGQPSKTKLLTVKNGYHGDTFAAMSVCDPVNGMHHLFKDNLNQQLFSSAPPPGFDRDCSKEDLADLRSQLEQYHQQIAAIIIEPIVQGAGGMRIYSPSYLKQISALSKEFNVLFIADEIATGFGRTGKLFACEHAGVEPDILCLGKALTGGYMTLAATLCSDKLADGICQGDAGVFMHGPTFMANPLACSVALASCRLLLQKNWQQDINRIEKTLEAGLAPLRQSDRVADVRVLGAIAVVEMKQTVEKSQLQEELLEQGVWLRPFGRLVYTMPPFICNEQELTAITSAMVKCLA